MHEILVDRLGGQSLSRKRVVSLTDRPDMAIDAQRERKTTTQQQLSPKLFQTHTRVNVFIWADL